MNNEIKNLEKVYNGITVRELKKRIENFFINQSYLDEDVEKKLCKIFNKRFVLQIQNGNLSHNHPIPLYRIRRINQECSHESLMAQFAKDNELWERPALGAERGRLNEANETILYLNFANSHLCIPEAAVSENEKFILIEYNNKEILYLNTIGRPIDKSCNSYLTDDTVVKVDLIHDFLIELFTSKGKDYYRATNAIKRLFYSIPNSPNGDLDGWEYPSVHSDIKNPLNMNIALKPESAHKKLVVSSVKLCKFCNGKIIDIYIIA